MKIWPYIIVLLCLFQVSIYAQKSAQVTLSIRLYPIQTIEVAPADTQMFKVSNQGVGSNSNQVSSCSQQLSVFSTSPHTSHVDSITGRSFEVLRVLREIPEHIDRSIDRFFDDEKFDYETDGDEMYLVYSMEVL